jgi:hypothetical protein
VRFRSTDAADSPTEAAGAETTDGRTPGEGSSRPGVTPKKGRPTTSLAEAEERNRRPLVYDRKTARRVNKSERQKMYALQQEAMRTGEEKYLPQRDRGPVRRDARNWIDSRFLPSQVFLPGAFVIMIGMLIVGRWLPGMEGYVVLAMYLLLLLAIVVSAIAVHVMKRQLIAKHGADKVRGVVWYSFIRSMYPRFLRQPKPQVKIGGEPR